MYDKKRLKAEIVYVERFCTLTPTSVFNITSMVTPSTFMQRMGPISVIRVTTDSNDVDFKSKPKN